MLACRKSEKYYFAISLVIDVPVKINVAEECDVFRIDCTFLKTCQIAFVILLFLKISCLKQVCLASRLCFSVYDCHMQWSYCMGGIIRIFF